MASSSCEADVLILQETHWGFANLFDVRKFWVVHSGASDHRFQGCAVLIRKTLAEVTALRWAPVIAGRHLHVRFPFQGKHVNIVCVYQFSWSYVGDAEALRSKRGRMWIRLDELPYSLPHRNTLILGGDINTSATFGPSTRRSRCPQPDQQLFPNLIECTRSMLVLGPPSRTQPFPSFAGGTARVTHRSMPHPLRSIMWHPPRQVQRPWPAPSFCLTSHRKRWNATFKTFKVVCLLIQLPLSSTRPYFAILIQGGTEAKITPLVKVRDMLGDMWRLRQQATAVSVPPSWTGVPLSMTKDQGALFKVVRSLAPKQH